jgi:hypothetical protein
MSMLATAAAVLTITVRVYDLYGLPPAERAAALTVASETLAQAGVDAAWIDCSRVGDVVPAPCLRALQPGEMVLRIQDRTARGNHILGTAIVQERGPSVVASIYAESVSDRSIKSGVPYAILLGRVTAHEIGHLLIGTNSHAPRGLMRASWDLKFPHPSEWRFTREDAVKMRRTLLAQTDGDAARGTGLED